LIANYITEGTIEDKPDESNLSINFSLNKQLPNGKYLKFQTFDYGKALRNTIYFGSSSSTLSISNYSYNKLTGKLTFDYEMNIVSYENTTYSPAKIVGSVNVTIWEQDFARTPDTNVNVL
jgi:hypothetical protein